MKNSKTIIAMLLVCMMLVLTACGGAEDPSGSGTSSGGTNSGDPAVSNTNAGGPGRYVETDVTPAGEEVQDLLQLADGTIVLFTKGLTARYDSTDGGQTFTKTEWPGAPAGSLEQVSGLSMTEDGTVYAVKGDPDGIETELVRVTPEGAVESVSLEALDTMKAEGKVPYIYQMQVLSGNKILLGVMDASRMMSASNSTEGTEGEEDPNVSDEDGQSAEADGGGMVFSAGGSMQDIMGVFDLNTGARLYDLPEDLGMQSVAVYGDSFYVFDYEGNISIRDVETGKEVKKVAVQAEEPEDGAAISYSFSTSSTLSPDGQAFSQDSKGVYRQDLETGAKERIFDAAAHSFGLAQNYARRFYAVSNEAFIMQVEDNSGSKVYRYAYDANAVSDPDKVLEIWALQDSGTLRAAISSFLKKNPDATVNLTIGTENQGAQETADIIQNLNTRILAGDGPDILLLDGLPAESYAEKGMLMDLRGLMDFSEAYEQLLTPLESGGSLYYFPARFKTSLLLTTADQLPSFSDLESMVQAIENGKDKALSASDSGDPFGSISEEERPVFEFSSLEEVFESLYPSSAGKIIENGKINADAVGTFLDALKRISDKYKLAEESEDANSMAVLISGTTDDEIISGNVISYMSGRALSGSFVLGSLSYLSLFESEGTQYAILPGLTEGAYIPSTMMGISAGSGKADLAAEFLQNMLTEDVQGVFGGGFPMTGKGFDAQLKELSEMEVYGMETSNSIAFDMQSFLSLLKTPVVTDQVVMSAVQDAATAYCKGEMELDAAVTEIEEATRLYLAEQS